MLFRIESNECGDSKAFGVQSAHPPCWEGMPQEKKGVGGVGTEVSEEKKKSDRERDSERSLGKAHTNERRSSKVVVVPRAHSTAVSGGPTVQ